MPAPKFALGDIACPDPTGRGLGTKGKVTGITDYIDGSIAYTVSVFNRHEDNITRHVVGEDEICKPNEEN